MVPSPGKRGGLRFGEKIPLRAKELLIKLKSSLG
jgi:hypothetical protein